LEYEYKAFFQLFLRLYRGALKMQDMKMKDQVARHENAGQEHAGHANATHKQ